MSKKVVYKAEPLLAHLIEEEAKRNSSLEERYRNALESLPKGKLYVRKFGRGKKSRKYVYLSRRLPGQEYPESKYIGRVDSEKVKEIEKQINDRQRLEKQLEALAIEKRMIEKALNEYRRSC